MGQVTIEVNGKPYIVGCEDGQETRLRQLAAEVDAQVRQVSEEVGQLGETRLLLMGALLLADELSEIRSRMSAAEGDARRGREEMGRAEAAAIAALEAAAVRVEAMTAEAADQPAPG